MQAYARAHDLNGLMHEFTHALILSRPADPVAFLHGVLGERMAFNYRTADLDRRQRAMLDFAAQLTTASATVEEADRQALRDAGFSDRDIFDIASVAAFFNMTNRVASAVAMAPNPEYHAAAR